MVAPKDDTPESTPRVPAPGSFTPRVRPAAIAGDTAPAGASFARPTPAPLPDRGAPLLLFITLAAALLAVTFTILIASKL
ncbi:MAG: hypothetical protein IAE82_03645 [Opitutaceae bacterium]|nr:hypothetical protein [Opitutaceae bacterium]